VSCSSGSPLLRPFTDYYPGAVSRASQLLNPFGYQWPCRDPGGIFNCGSTVATSTDKFRHLCHRLSTIRGLTRTRILSPWGHLVAATARRVGRTPRIVCPWGHLVAPKSARRGFITVRWSALGSFGGGCEASNVFYDGYLARSGADRSDCLTRFRSACVLH